MNLSVERIRSCVFMILERCALPPKNLKQCNVGAQPRRAEDSSLPATSRRTRDASRRWLQ